MPGLVDDPEREPLRAAAAQLRVGHDDAQPALGDPEAAHRRRRGAALRGVAAVVAVAGLRLGGLALGVRVAGRLRVLVGGCRAVGVGRRVRLVGRGPDRGAGERAAAEQHGQHGREGGELGGGAHAVTAVRMG